MKSTGSRPRKRKRISHTTGRASHRHSDKSSDVQPIPKQVVWIIAAFVILAVIIILFVLM